MPTIRRCDCLATPLSLIGVFQVVAEPGLTDLYEEPAGEVADLRRKNWRPSDGSPMRAAYQQQPGARSGWTGQEANVVAGEIMEAAEYLGERMRWTCMFAPILRSLEDWTLGGPAPTLEKKLQAQGLYSELMRRVAERKLQDLRASD